MVEIALSETIRKRCMEEPHTNTIAITLANVIAIYLAMTKVTTT